MRSFPVTAFIGLVCFALLVGCANTMSPEEKNAVRRASAIRDVGIDHLAAGRTALAIRKLEQAEQLEPDDPVTLLWLGEAFRRKGMLDRAEAYLLRGVEHSPGSTDHNYQETALNLSALYIQMKRYEDAIRWSDELVDDPTFATPWRPLTNRGWAEFQLGRLDEARKSFANALDFFPSYWPAHLNMGILEQKERHPLAAIRHFENVLVQEKHLPYDAAAEANYRMAEVYVSLGKRKSAIEHFSIALERSPYGEWGTQSKSYLELLR